MSRFRSRAAADEVDPPRLEGLVRLPQLAVADGFDGFPRLRFAAVSHPVRAEMPVVQFVHLRREPREHDSVPADTRNRRRFRTAAESTAPVAPVFRPARRETSCPISSNDNSSAPLVDSVAGLMLRLAIATRGRTAASECSIWTESLFAIELHPCVFDDEVEAVIGDRRHRRHE